jgi:hypothetical protein
LIQVVHSSKLLCIAKLISSLDPARFTNCYEIPHWRMPPMRVLSMMAAKTYHTVLNHFSFVHQPTFRLHDTAACLAFAICTVGGIKASDIENRFKAFLPSHMQATIGTGRMDGPVGPEATWESTYARNYTGQGTPNRSSGWSSVGAVSPEADAELEDEKRIVEEWESADLVRNDKTNMLVKVG